MHPSLRRVQVNRLVRALGWMILLAGAAARLRQYVFNRALWFDEATLALNIVGRSFAGLAQPLDYHQGAPIGFLWMQKALITVLGNNDLVLRLLPCAAGIGSLLLMRNLTAVGGTPARRLTGLLALALFACSGQLIYYSSEAKQYSVDVLVALSLVTLARNCLRARGGSRQLVILGSAGMLAVWISHPAIFVIGGIWAALLFRALRDKKRARVRLLLLLLTAQAISFAALYLVALRALAAQAYLLQYWQAGFMPLPPWRDPAWFASAFRVDVEGLMGLSPAILAVALLIAGYASLLLHKPHAALGGGAMLAGLLVASGLQKYPVSGRLVLFAAPLTYMLVAEGAWALYRLVGRLNRPTAVVAASLAAAVLLYGAVRASVGIFLHPTTHDEIKPVMEYLQERRATDEAIYVYWRAGPAFIYYAPFYGVSGAEFSVGSEDGGSERAYDEDIDRLPRGRRVWLVFADRCSGCKVDEQYFLRRLGGRASRVDQVRAEGAAAFLYSLRP